MSIGIIAYQRAVINPNDAFGTQIFLQSCFNLLLCEGLVAMGSHQTAGGGKHRSLAIALNASTLQDKVKMRFVLTFYDASVEKMLVNLVVESGFKLLAPSIETEKEAYACRMGTAKCRAADVAARGY